MSSATTNDPGKPKASGYAETKPNAPGAHDKPDPEAPGGEASQVEATLPDEDEEVPEDGDDAPPGEHKREPIKDPDPADTKLHV
jgi:hypothetical protein